MKRNRLIIWGCGGVYNAHVLHLKLLEEKGEAEIVGVISRNLKCGSQLDGFPILSKEDISEIEHDYLIIMAYGGDQGIIREYIEAGGAREKVLPYRVLDIPGLSLSDYFQIRNARFSIVSEFCFGGTLYRYLGLEALSPFKNLWICPEHYFQLLDDLPRYLSEPPAFWKLYDGPDPPADCPHYPILRLGGDVLLHCNHDTDPDRALENWNRRCRRINYENILVTFYAADRKAEEAFYKRRRYAARRCFTPYRSDLPDSVFVPNEGGDLPITETLAIAMGTNPLVDIYSFFYGPVKHRRI